MNLAKKKAAEGTLILAETQSEGRGRAGRSWFSLKGCNLYLSLILRPACNSRGVSWISLMAGVALVETIEQVCGLYAKVKWPNDVEISNRKVGGILTESTLKVDQVESVILGIGININMGKKDFPQELRSTATSLQIESGKFFNRTKLLQRLLKNLEAWYGIFLKSSTEQIRQAYLLHFNLVGQSVAIRQAGSLLSGTVLGISSDGALKLRQADQAEIEVYSGDVLKLSPSYASDH